MFLLKSCHDFIRAGAAANGFSLGVMVISFVRVIVEGMTARCDTHLRFFGDAPMGIGPDRDETATGFRTR
jgi:hypothetical protein